MNLEEEILCGHLVTAQKKRVNAMYLEMLGEFGRLCERAHITWWVMFGSLIGAARHHGFIPWDDDIDIVVPRADFDRLLKMSSEDFGAVAPYFLQTPHTAKNFQQRILRFRRSDTAYLTPYDIKMIRKAGGEPYDLGLALAIFPLDNVPKSDWYRSLQLRVAHAGVSYRVPTEKSRKKPVRDAVFKAIEAVVSERMIVWGIHEMYRLCRRNRSGLVQTFNGFIGDRNVWPAECFAETVYLPFEDITVPVPAGYDTVLRTTYGDYMTFPPPEARVEKHADYMSADIPWQEAWRMFQAGEIELREDGAGQAPAPEKAHIT